MEEKEIHLLDYFKVLYKRKYTVVTFFIIVSVVVIIGALSTTPVYEATTKVLVEKVEIFNPSMMVPIYPSYDPEFYDTQLHLIKSTPVARKVIHKLSLDKLFELRLQCVYKHIPVSYRMFLQEQHSFFAKRTS